jgi:hypothetical protein
MKEQETQLVQQIFNKHSLEECSVDEVRNVAEQYPYFSTAQFLFLKKLNKDSDEYNKQLQKCMLYHHNILEFDAFINSEHWKSDLQLFTLKKYETSNANVADDKKLNYTESKTFDTPITNYQAATHIHIPDAAMPVSPSVNEKPDELVFEPYHTVDYFASQGIKLSREENANDALSRQLKSFTEWLKTMKRLPVAAITKNMDAGSEKKIEDLAADSLAEPIVVTEAMAEVWVMQGNREKAIEVYDKLGLLNPSKSAYFAAQIDKLKRK